MKIKLTKIFAIVMSLLLVLSGCAELMTKDNVDTAKKIINETTKEEGASSKDDKKNENDNVGVNSNESNDKSSGEEIKEDGIYFKKDDVVAYLIKYDRLPKNYLTKNEARNKGWDSRDGNLWDVTDKGVIGGDRFGNREGLLPNAKGRKYFEADVNYEGGFREAERLIYSNDGLIYYTKDHYKTFEQIRGN